jgi:hypothetical protein
LKEGIIDEVFAKGRIERYKQMYPDLDVIGWYSATKDL